MKSKARLFFGSLALLLFSSVLPAAPNLWLTVDELSDQATYIVEGRVLDVRSEWNNDRTQIYTYVKFAVAQSLKERFPLPEITFRLLGGEILEEEIGMYIPELPVFRAQDEMLLFLDSNPQSFFPFIGHTQGVYYYTTDPATSQEVAINQEDVTLLRTELITRVREAVQR